MKICSRCNRENEDKALFCINCGAQLPSAFNAEPPPTLLGNQSQNSTFQAPAAAAAQPKKKSNKTLFLILGAIVFGAFLLVGAGAVIGLFLLLGSMGDPAKPTNTNRSTPQARTNNNSPKTLKTDSASQPLFDPPTQPTSQGRFIVSANTDWQLSNIEVVANEMYQTKVSGRIDLAGIKSKVSAEGVNDANSTSRRLFPEFPTGALVMRTRYANGEYSNMQAVTAANATGNWQNAPDEIGRLEFIVNDNSPEANSGQFTVDITLINVPK